MPTFRQTVSDLRADLARRRVLEQRAPGLWSTCAVLAHRGSVAVIIYRLNRYCVSHRLRILHFLLGSLEYFLTRCEISPLAQIGPGLVIDGPGAVGITQVVVAGRNCTFLGRNSITLGAMEDFDVERDRIVLGDHCVVGPGARVMRPVVLAAGTQIKANSIAMKKTDTPGTILSGVPARPRGSAHYAEVVNWNPLLGGRIDPAASGVGS